MLHVLLIVFLISLFYLSIANRMTTYINVLAMQGILLFIVGYYPLTGGQITGMCLEKIQEGSLVE